MKKLTINITILVSIYFFYRLAIFLSVIILNKSEYDTFSALNYGNDNKKEQIILLGSSNTRYDFNYDSLNLSFKNKAVHSVSSSTPYGLYFTLKKFITSKWNTKDNIVIIDIPYSLYTSDQFLPVTDETMRLMDIKTSEDVLLTNPRIFFSYIFNESFFNKDFLGSNLSKLKNYKFNNQLTKNDSSLVVLPLQNFKDDYKYCTTHYIKEKQHLEDVTLNEKHLRYIKSYIDYSIRGKVYYLLPEINRNNYSISENTIRLFSKAFHPINSFESSQFMNDQMYDQWYHLNACGARVNTNNLIRRLKRLGI